MTVNYLDRNTKFLLLTEEKVADGGTRYLPLQNFYRRRMTEEVKTLRIARNRKRYDVLYHLFRQPAADTFSSVRKRNFYSAALSAFRLLPIPSLRYRDTASAQCPSRKISMGIPQIRYGHPTEALWAWKFLLHINDPIQYRAINHKLFTCKKIYYHAY
jgi:hypothetical protein